LKRHVLLSFDDRYPEAVSVDVRKQTGPIDCMLSRADSTLANDRHTCT